MIRDRDGTKGQEKAGKEGTWRDTSQLDGSGSGRKGRDMDVSDESQLDGTGQVWTRKGRGRTIDK
jgi:hypothetical protein